MMDQAVVAGIQPGYAEQLANMRIPGFEVLASNPRHSSEQPHSAKKLLWHQAKGQCLYIHDHENGAEDSNVALEKPEM